MNNKAQGTPEIIALELTRLLEPLKDNLAAGKARFVLAELGIGLTPAQEAALAVPLKNTADNTALLILRSRELLAAAEVNDTVLILEKVAEVAGDIINVIDSFIGIKNGINGLGLPELPLPVIEKIPERLFNYLTVRYLDRLQGVVPSLSFLGILEQSEGNILSVDPALPPFTLSAFHLNRIGGWLSNPSGQLKSLYKWGDPAFNGKLLFDKLEDIFSRLSFPVIYDELAPDPKLDMVYAEVIPKTDINPKGIAIILKNTVGNRNQHFTGNDWDLHYTLDFTTPANTQLVLQPDGNIFFIPPSAVSVISGKVLIDLVVKKEDAPEPFVILGKAGGSRFEVLEFQLKTGTELSWNGVQNKAEGSFFIEGAIKNCKIVINTSGGDGFLQKLLPAVNFEAGFDLGIGISSEGGFYIQGSSSLEIRLPVHIALGPVSLEGLILALKPKDGAFPVEIGADIKGQLGPLTAVVSNIGMRAAFSFPPGNNGNFGPLQLDIGFKPPNGVGLSLDTGLLKGGGFLYLDFDKGEYFGALEFDFKGMFSLKAVGIITTKMPDGSQGFSLLIIITAEFVPIQLGFGFTLNGVGGLLGLNRTVKVDVLREGVRTNAIKSILFPEDVVANISRIISDIRQVFPPMNDRFLICPMAKLGWGTPSVITLEMGLLLEIPVPRIIILGVLKALLPEENVPLLRLQVNFLGIIDFENKYLSFDASLYDSRLLIYTLTGDMALRLSWGDNPVFILTVGGFHPAFKEAPGDLQNMTRLTVSLLSGNNPRITMQSYYAVTSNTVQFGAKAELYAAAAGFNVYGFIGYDVLFQFDPFRFIADIYAGLALRRGTSVIMGIKVSGQLSGPRPWDAKGEASFSILFFDVTISFHETWGDRADKVEPEKADIKQMLTAELNDNRNWKADIPNINNLHVSIKELKVPAGKVVVHPFGVLTFSQRLVPLDFELQKFGNKVPKDEKRFGIKPADPGVTTQEVKEQFAPANFTVMKDNEKLSSPSFEQMKSGFKLTGSSALQVPSAVSKSVDYELTYLRKKRLSFAGLYKYARNLFHANTKAGSIAKSSLSHAVNRMSANAPEPVTIKEEQFAIANKSDMRLHGRDMVAGSYAEAVQLYNELVREQPALKDQVQILSHYELNEI